MPTVTHGTLKPCCTNPTNLVLTPITGNTNPRASCRQCVVCGARHYHLQAETARFTLATQSLGPAPQED